MILDIWISILITEAFLGLSIHYVDNGWVLHHFLLDIILFKARHIGINIVKHIIRVLNEFGLMNKILALITNNKSAIVIYNHEMTN